MSRLLTFIIVVLLNLYLAFSFLSIKSDMAVVIFLIYLLTIIFMIFKYYRSI